MDNNNIENAEKNSQLDPGNQSDNLTTPDTSNNKSPRFENEAESYLRQSQSGAIWFYWIAGLSVFNTVINLANGTWGFLAGLGITQLIDGLAKGLLDSIGGMAIAIGLFLDLMAAGVFVVFGFLAKKRQSWAYIVGMVCYALDGLIFFLAQEWLSIAFHVFVLYFIYKGMSATIKLNDMSKQKEPAIGQSA